MVMLPGLTVGIVSLSAPHREEYLRVRLGRHALWQEGAAFFYDERPLGRCPRTGGRRRCGAHDEPMPDDGQAFDFQDDETAGGEF